jgi:hypothetical protein
MTVPPADRRRRRGPFLRLFGSLLFLGVLPHPHDGTAADLASGIPLPRQHAEESFQALSHQERQSSDDYLRGVGEGDLSKGRVACQRVAELSARTEIAKQIRVQVTEHAVDRLRERTGQPIQQEFEVVREEVVNELLRDVRIIDKRVDEAAGTCRSVAVMPKSRISTEVSAPSSDRAVPFRR